MKDQQRGVDMERWLTPQRTSTYERPFTQEGNYLVFNCCHFVTDCLHDYVQFTIYCLEVHFRYCEAQPISAISPKNALYKAPVASQH